MKPVLTFLFLLFNLLSYAQENSVPWFLIKMDHEGPEDFVYDSVYNRLIIPSGKRDVKHPEDSYGVFQTLNLDDHSVKTLSQDEDLNEWVSLGIKYAPFDTTFQYMTNAKNSIENKGRIQGLSISENSVNLVSTSLTVGDLPPNLNNLRWIEGKGLYMTNLYKSKTLIGGFFSNMKGEVYRLDNFGEKAEVILNAHGPNSIGVLDSSVYLTGTRERFLLKITKNDDAEKMKTIPLVGGDNITIQDDMLYTTGSPKVFEVMKHMNEKRETTGSFIYELTNENGVLRCSRIILVDPSVGVGMISVVYKHKGAFYCGQVRCPVILSFKDDESSLIELSAPNKNKYTRKIYARYKRLNRRQGITMPEFITLRSK